ncbi:MAG: OmpH family outer membrane protein [Prevotellaceae bacterium]|nr:OmpH family outer membrane protein [Prevotellaceae bacterium]
MKMYFTSAILLMVASMLFSACGAKSEEEFTTESTQTDQTSNLRIAYVELDTLMSQYQLYKDYSEVLTRKGNNIQKTLAQKQRALENHAAAVQKKYESNGFTTRDEVERAQASIQKEQNELAELADRLQTEFAMEQARINDEARDSIQSFLKRYNKTKKFDYVMVKAGDNLLIANPKYNITDDIVKGLNKRYKIKPEVAELIKASKEIDD